MPLLGIISDTHNYFDPGIPEYFQDVDHILHGGDVGRPNIIHQLEQIAPVTAVLGNTDEPAYGYRLTEVFRLDQRKILVHHIVNPDHLGESLAARLAVEKPDVVVFGHTHKPFCETIGGILFLNPGAAGHARFGLERSLALLEFTARGFRPRFVTLPATTAA